MTCRWKIFFLQNIQYLLQVRLKKIRPIIYILSFLFLLLFLFFSFVRSLFFIRRRNRLISAQNSTFNVFFFLICSDLKRRYRRSNATSVRRGWIAKGIGLGYLVDCGSIGTQIVCEFNLRTRAGVATEIGDLISTSSEWCESRSWGAMNSEPGEIFAKR